MEKNTRRYRARIFFTQVVSGVVLRFGLAAVVAYVDSRRIGIPADQFRLYAGQPAWFQSADIEGGPKISGRAVAR